jgi:hypothetical protein
MHPEAIATAYPQALIKWDNARPMTSTLGVIASPQGAEPDLLQPVSAAFCRQDECIHGRERDNDMPRIERICTVCGRSIGWRRKWARNWDNIKYCSDACRRRGLTQRDRQIEQTIIDLLEQRAADASICPSEAARIVADGDDWRADMEPVRMAARRLQRAGRISITQKGRQVNPDTAKGPIRLRLRGIGLPA